METTSSSMTEDFIERLNGIQSPLRGFVYAHLHDAGRVDDVVQEVSIVLWRKFDQYRPDSPFLAWALGIARNKILQAHRQSSRSRLVFDDDMAQRLAECYVDSESELEERRAILSECISRLPEPARELIQLRYTQGLSFQQMARRLARKVNTVTMAVSRIRATLIACVDRHALESSGEPA